MPPKFVFEFVSWSVRDYVNTFRAILCNADSLNKGPEAKGGCATFHLKCCDRAGDYADAF